MRGTLKEILKEKLTEEERKLVKSAYDVVGDVVIIEIPEELEHKEKDIAQTLLDRNKNYRVVAKKVGIHHGEFRTQEVKAIAGEDSLETIHRENGIRLKLHVGTVYFSPRLSTERKRIAELIQEGERILVMFCGCAPYPCVLSRNTKAEEIVGVELNPNGHEYGEKNLKLNKTKNVTLHNGDVRDIVPTLGTFDRILMPLPKSAEDFLDVAFKASKTNTIIHFYDFLHENDIPGAALEKIEREAKKAGVTYEVKHVAKCGQHAPRTFRICVDFIITS